MEYFNAYEKDDIGSVMGCTFRPGGLALTERAVTFCNFTSGDAVLDIGCGFGDTVAYLNEKYNIKSVGIDLSEKIIKEAKNKYKNCDFIVGRGEELPFIDGTFKGVLAECTLSLSFDLECIIKEVYRILENGGWFVITDMYAKSPEHISALTSFSMNGCIRNLHNLPLLQERLKSFGFYIYLIEEHSNYLKELLVKSVFSCGSMKAFWNASSQDQIDGDAFNKILKLCRPGYFMLIAKKYS